MKSYDFLMDDTFLSWYFESDDEAWQRWEDLRKKDPLIRREMDDSAKIIEAILADNIAVNASQQQIAHTRLMNRILSFDK